MKKRTLAFLLLVPFVIGLLTYVSVVALDRTVASVPNISLNYGENYGFQINGEYLLECTLYYDGDITKVADGSTPVWSVSNWTGSEDTIPTTSEHSDEEWYLTTYDEEGTCTITAALENGRSQASFTAHIYSDGLIVINPSTYSNDRIDEDRYYGEYDLSYSSLNDSNPTKNHAEITFNYDIYSEYDNPEAELVDKSSNISVSLDNDNNVATITANDSGSAYFTLQIDKQSYITQTYSFEIVDNGVNVYSYEDLLMCTNKSSSGEIVCLQINLQSLSNTYTSYQDSNGNTVYEEEYQNDNNRFFGIYDFDEQDVDYSDLIYYQDSTLPTTFMDEFFASGEANSEYDYATQMKIGIRVQKDFYGNGFNINLNELCYPRHGTIGSTSGKLEPGVGDLFTGPLTFVSIGDIQFNTVIRAYLIDNVGMLLDGDGITLNDLKIQNTNSVSNMYNLAYTGTVLEAQGDNITIENSIVQYGRTGVRAFSSDGLLIDNCIIQNCGEFCLKLGSNRINGYDKDKEVSISYGDDTITGSFEDVIGGSFALGTDTADYLETYGYYYKNMGLSDSEIHEALDDIQASLDNYDGIINSDGSYNYDASVTVRDTYFYNSGIFSIAFESSFNGHYLYNGLPTFPGMLGGVFGILPTEVGGTSYPIELTLEGDTRFYDWKNIDDIDLTLLIEENLSTALEDFLGDDSDYSDVDLSIDSYLPIKDIIKEYAHENGLAYEVEGEDGETDYYVNTAVAYYGGGFNGSQLIDNTSSSYTDLCDPYEADIVEYSIEHSSVVDSGNMMDLLSINTITKCVVSVIGAHPFKFVTNDVLDNDSEPNLFGEAPSISDLINRS